MKVLQSILILLVVMTIHDESEAFQNSANYDEAKIPAYQLPKLLEFNDGSEVKTKSDWPARRSEILGLFKEHVYGTMPPRPKQSASPDFDVVKESTFNAPVDPDDKASETVEVRLKEVKLFLGPDKSGPVAHLALFMPAADAKGETSHPTFLAYNFQGNHTVHPTTEITISETWNREREKITPAEKTRGAASRRWPIGMIVEQGYALATVYYGDVDPDFDDGFKNGVHPLFPELQNRPDNWTSIGGWAWATHRVMDYFEVESDVDQNRVALLGHSRLGKTALWAGATDERFALIISNNSGCGGAALARRAIGETVARINKVFPHWFCAKHNEYNNNENGMPVDQHMLIALMAPRPVYIASAKEDRWADPRGEFLSAFHAQPAWELLGEKAMGVSNPDMPAIENSIGHRVGYHIRNGKHNVTTYDWTMFLNFFRTNID
ncbi:MAG: acetylxylan esterase [Mariniblastus sp.]